MHLFALLISEAQSRWRHACSLFVKASGSALEEADVGSSFDGKLFQKEFSGDIP
jgi:hypothetical protein